MLMHGGMNSWLSAGFGLVNGLLIQLFRLPSIIATLATLSIYRGLIYALSNGNQVIGLTDPFANFVGGQFFGIATNIWILLAVVVLFSVILYATPFGYRVRAIGSNPDAAEFSVSLLFKYLRQMYVSKGGTYAIETTLVEDDFDHDLCASGSVAAGLSGGLWQFQRKYWHRRGHIDRRQESF